MHATYILQADQLLVSLTSRSSIGPGATVAVAPESIAPQGRTGCSNTVLGASDVCCEGSATISVSAPCDDPSTSDEVERCVAPIAQISAPHGSMLRPCEAATLQLSGEFSSGGGARALSYKWYVVPGETDNEEALTAFLLGVNASSLSLNASLLAGGNTFTFGLTVSSFLGAQSDSSLLTVVRQTEEVHYII